MFKRCRQNNKQRRPWSDCSMRSSLIWFCTVCSDLSVPIFKIISVCSLIPALPEIKNFSRKYSKYWARSGIKQFRHGLSACKGDYRKNSKNWDTLNYYRDCPTNGIVGFYSAILRSKDADRITNRVDTDQTAPWGAVWSGSALFAQTYLSQYFKLLRYPLSKASGLSPCTGGHTIICLQIKQCSR